MIVNFVFPLNWTVGYPDIWPNIIWGVSVSVFSMK